MHGSVNLDRLFAIQSIYSDYYKFYLERGINLTLDPNDFQNRFADKEEEANYY
jgi:hypothetical protein